MRRSAQIAMMLAMLATTAAAPMAGAQNAQASRMTDQQILTLLTRTTRNAERFSQQLDRGQGGQGQGQGRGQGQGNVAAAVEYDVDQLINELLDTTAHLRDHQVRRQVIANDVEEVLVRGSRIDEFMRRNQIRTAAENSWITVRRDLDALASAFNLRWDWASPRTPVAGPAYYSRLSGTYELDRGRSDNVQRIASQFARSMPASQRQRFEQDLLNRLTPPEFISLDRNGRTISIASSMGPRVTFDIDGRPRSEPNGYGGTSLVRASFYGDELMVTTTGDQGRDFTVNFEPLDAGATLRVTRSLTATGLSQRVQAQSFYRRTENQPRWNVYGTPTRNSVLVPDGIVLVGRLDRPLGSRTSVQGDRFSLTVSGPQQFQGAVIDGIVGRVGSERSDRNELILNFDRIRLRDGRMAEFQGVLSHVRLPNGDTVRIDTEGVARGGTRTRDVVGVGAIGAGIGALIGAVAGGGKGAAIGAAIGAGAGAGSVYVVGRDRDIQLPAGTELQIVAESYPDRERQ